MFHLLDTTLRDGEQAPGVAFAPEEKRAIARELAAAGVREIEVGTPAMGEHEVRAIQSVVRLRLGCRLTAWCRAREEDLAAAVTCGVDAVHLSLPMSPSHLRSLGKSEQWVLDATATLVAQARRHFAFVSLGLQDASRADLAFLVRVAQAAAALRVNRLRLADTVGTWNPFQVQTTVAHLRQAVPDLPLGFHGHNDLGMATANTLAALAAGSASADVTVNGLGERAGNAPLEEVVMALEVSLGQPSGIDRRALGRLARLVARASGRPIPPGKPITGRAAFRHESGIHVQSLLRDRTTYEAFDPRSIGRRASQIVIGKHSGRAALRHALRDQGLDVDAGQLEQLLPRVRAAAERCKRPLSPRELLRLARKAL